MLKVQELQVNYGGIRAVKNISFEVPDGSIVTLVGANGAGKSTTLRTIAGQVKAQAVSEFIAAPVFAALVYIIIGSGIGEHKVQNLALVADAGAQILRDGADIFHDGLGICEDISIDTLENIGLSAVGSYFAGQINVAAAEFDGADRAALDTKVTDRRFHTTGVAQNGIILSVVFLILCTGDVPV